MPVNITDGDAWIDFLDTVAERLERNHQKPMRDAINRFWQAMNNLPFALDIMQGARARLEEELNTIIFNVYTDTINVYAPIFLRVERENTATNAERRAFFDLVYKRTPDEIVNQVIDLARRFARLSSRSIADSILAQAQRIVSTGLAQGKSLVNIAREMVTGRRIGPRGGVRQVRASAIDRARRALRNLVLQGRDLAQEGWLAAGGRDRYPTKTWYTQRDERVRPTHVVLEGETIPSQQDFLVGGFAATRPRDPRLPPAESINCRCIAVYNSR